MRIVFGKVYALSFLWDQALCVSYFLFCVFCYENPKTMCPSLLLHSLHLLRHVWWLWWPTAPIDFCYVFFGPGGCGGTSVIYVSSEGALVIPQPVEQGRILPNARLFQSKKERKEKLKACQIRPDFHILLHCFVRRKCKRWDYWLCWFLGLWHI